MSEPWDKAPVEWRAPEKRPSKLGIVNREIANTLGAPVDLVAGALGSLGYENEEPFLGSRSISRGFEYLGADVAPEGFEPEGYAERAAQGVGQAAGFLIPGGAAVGAATKAPGVVGGAARTVAAPFVRSPATAVAIEGAAGAGAGAGGLAGERQAEDLGVSPGVARVAGELIGGGAAALGPAAAFGGLGRVAQKLPVVGAVTRGLQAGVAPFTEAGARARASRRLRDLSGAPERDYGRITGVSEGNLTPAQQTGNKRLMALEREVLATDSELAEEFAARSRAGAEQLREAVLAPAEGQSPQVAREFLRQRRENLTNLLETRVQQAGARAQQALQDVTPALRETEASRIVRNEIETAYRAARDTEGELWADVPQNVTVGTQNAGAAFNRHVEELGRVRYDDMPQAAREFLDPDRNAAFGEQESAREMHGLYSRLREEARRARANEQRNTARIADDLADAVLLDLEAAEGVGEPLRIARDFSRELNRTFTQGSVGSALGYAREGGRAVSAEETLNTLIGGSGARATVRAGEMQRAMAGGQEGINASEDYLRRRFTEYAAPRGEFSPDRARDFLRKNAELLDRFPRVRQQVVEATESGAFADEARRTVDTGLREAGQTAEARFVESPYAKEFESILQAQDPGTAAREIARMSSLDQTGNARRGLKASALDHLMGKTQTGVDAEGGIILDPDRMRAVLSDPRAGRAIREILDPADLMRLNRVMQEMDAMKTARGQLPSVGPVMDDRVNSVISFIARTIGARQGAKLGQGTSGASLLTANFASRRVQRILEGLTNDRAERLIRDAITDPDLFKALLIPGNTMKGAVQIERRLAAWLAGEAGVISQPNRETDREKDRRTAPWASAPVEWQR